MKKILGFLFIVFLISCGSSVENIKKNNETKESKESIFVQKEVEITKDNLESYLIGTWEAEDLGVILDQYGYSLPAKITFNQDQTYSWEYMNNGLKIISSGKYQITDKKSIPYRIVFFQEKELNSSGSPVGKKQVKEMRGIFDFTKSKKLKTVYYDKDFIPKVDEFQDLDIQIYRKLRK